MWAAQHYKFDKPNRWMTSGGLEQWVMVFQRLAFKLQPNKLVIDIVKEASVLMTMQEMSLFNTVFQLKYLF